MMPNRAAVLKEQYQNSIGLPFSDVLPEAEIQAVLEAQGVTYRQVLYTPIVVLWSWLSQVLDSDSSLSHAVKRVTTWMRVAGLSVPSADTGAYSKARKRWPESIFPPLVKRVATALQAQVSPAQRWRGRVVRAFDATTILMSDTEVNQRAYPQHSNQKSGCGFPLLKLQVWFCVTTGAVLEVAMAPFRVSEWRLARHLYQTLCPEDVVVADSAYGTYVDLAGVTAMGADAVFRKHHQRRCDFRRGKKLGIGDHIVRWQRPKKCPHALSPEEFEALPEALEVREVYLSIQVPGFRPSNFVVVTTLIDPKRYPRAKLAQLYQLRWQAAEVNLRHLKTTLAMEMVAAKTPTMVTKSIWVHLLAYNLLRTLMWEAGADAEVGALRLSLQGTRQQFNHFRPELLHLSPSARPQGYQALLNAVRELIIPFRPHRSEPRVVKRRPKPFPRMQEPRSVAKAKLVA
ncbi:Transposase InsG for insertion sequence element IS4 [Halomicronema hongdechloris C2206]|uniref:Transposase InsG for insertion sequence element IS4 n=1 Tax=Halomicronema hongdechloris C2206 TaxID=1641165 RepID=A0A1Z3HT21_9CYAN|nr:IS4 family transposase [Halomicronema hongdechloris]ASC73435.1 Transposase InsG for insertion sequence element IS4 [Halomicronema hongdechloris C2206]